MTDVEDRATLEEKSRKYARRRYALAFLNLFLAIGFLVLMTLHFTFPLRDFTEGLAGNYYLQLSVYYLFFCLVFSVVSLPLDFYSGYVLEHEFELSNQTVWGWFKNELKGGGLGFALTLPMVLVIYFLIRNFPEYWWLLGGVLLTMVSVIMVRIAPVLILPLFYKSTPLEDDGLKKALTPLAEDAGVTLEGVYKINLSKDTKKANAMLAGLGSTRRVIFGDTLLEQFPTEEILVVFAHELGHHVYRHLWKFLAVASAAGFIGLYIASRLLERLALELEFELIYDIATLPLLLLIMGTFAIILLPLENYYSRRLEAQCDLYALDKTRNPEAFISAMTRLAENNLADKEPSSIIEYIFYDHPTISKRIEMARQWAARTGGA